MLLAMRRLYLQNMGALQRRREELAALVVPVSSLIPWRNTWRQVSLGCLNGAPVASSLLPPTAQHQTAAVSHCTRAVRKSCSFRWNLTIARAPLRRTWPFVPFAPLQMPPRAGWRLSGVRVAPLPHGTGALAHGRSSRARPGSAPLPAVVHVSGVASVMCEARASTKLETRQ